MAPISRVVRNFALCAAAILAMSVSTSHAKFNCDSPAKDLQDAIDSAEIGETIQILGHCDEGPYFIRKDIGLSGPATLSAADGSYAVLSVIATNANLSNLTVDADGAQVGVIYRQSTGQIDNIVIEYASGPGRGLVVDAGSSVNVSGGEFRNDFIGILVLRNSYAEIGGSIIEDNSGSGITVGMSSSASIGGASVDSNDLGILVWRNSSIFLWDSTITNSSNIGLLVRLSGFVTTVSPPSTFESNRLDVQCDTMGMIDVSEPQIGDPGSTYDDGTCAIPNPIF